MTAMSSVPVGPVTQGAINVVQGSLAPESVFSQKLNNTTNSIFATKDTLDGEAEKITNVKAAAVDAYFDKYDMPLEGNGLKMVIEAEKNGLDWRLVAAIAVRESTGGKFACKRAAHNPFGWGSCKIGFKSNDDAIETVARNLGGNNPRTAYHYDNKTTLQILRAYNPPSVVPKYGEQVIKIMDTIGPMEIKLTDNTTA